MSILRSIPYMGRRLSNLYRLWVCINLRYFKRDYKRCLIVLLGIVLGAALFTGVRLATEASRESFSTGMDSFAGTADAVVTATAGPVDDRLVAALLKLPEVAAATPVLSVVVKVEGHDEALRIIGIAPLLDRDFRDFPKLRESPQDQDEEQLWKRLITEPYSLALSRRAGKSFGATAEDTLTLVHVSGRTNCIVAAVLQAEGLALVDGGMVAVADIATVQELAGRQGLLDRIDLRFSENVSRDESVAAIAKVLPEGVRLANPGDAAESGRAMILAYELNLTVLSFVSLFGGMFLVYGMVALNGATRRFDTAVLRSLGASRRTIFMLFLAEGGLLGLLGWIIAVPLAMGLTGRLTELVSGTIDSLFVRLAVPSVTLNPLELGASLAVTMSVALLAAAQPAREAMRVSAKEALYMTEERATTRTPALQAAVIGGLLVLLCRPLSLLPTIAGFPLPGYLGIFMLFCGFSLTAPLLLRFSGSYIAPWISRVGGIPALLAGRTLRDAGIRTAVSVGALITTSALFVALVIMTHSFRQTFTVWVDETVTGDLFLQPINADYNKYRDPMPSEFVERFQRRFPEADMLPYQRYYINFGDVSLQLETFDTDMFLKHSRFLFMKGDPETALAAMREGRGVIASETFANKTGLDVGDTFTVMVRGVTVSLPIQAVVRSYRTRGSVVYLSQPYFKTLSGINEIGGIRVFFPEPNRVKQAEAARSWVFLETQYGDRLQVTVGDTLRSEIIRIFDDTFSVTTVLLVIALIVAGLGIAATLAVLVLERRREISVLAAVGASNGQITGMIIWESLFLAAVGLVAGITCGFVLAEMLIFVINKQSYGWTFVYSVPWWRVLSVVPLVVIAAPAAALPAVRLALRTNLSESLRGR
ncbi:MAG: FtsX-like permease family protein [Xanthomonadales bacterium]|nr:FtsX-like permease family protein [Xanthomonadales bacterium]